MNQVTTLNEFKAEIKNLEVRKLYLPILKNLTSTDRLNTYCVLTQSNVVRLKVRGTVKKLTLRKS